MIKINSLRTENYDEHASLFLQAAKIKKRRPLLVKRAELVQQKLQELQKTDPVILELELRKSENASELKRLNEFQKMLKTAIANRKKEILENEELQSPAINSQSPIHI